MKALVAAVLVAVLGLVAPSYGEDKDKPVVLSAAELTKFGDSKGEVMRGEGEWAGFGEKNHGKKVQFTGIVESYNQKTGDVIVTVVHADPYRTDPFRKVKLLVVLKNKYSIPLAGVKIEDVPHYISKSKVKWVGIVTGTLDYNPKSKGMVIGEAEVELKPAKD